MAKPERPTLPFTLHGQRHLIGCALLVAAFLFALALYLQWGRVRDLRATLATPLPSTLANDLLSVTPAPAWGAYAFVKGGDTQAILLRERPEGPGAVVVLQALRAPELAVRALDVSPAVLAVKLTASYAAVLGKETSVKLLGSETRPHRSGVTAALFSSSVVVL